MNDTVSTAGPLQRIVGRLRDLAGYLWHEGRPGHDVAREAADEIVRLEHSASFYRRRCELLQEWQNKMRDPERQLVCDILANGQTLPDPNGTRYQPPNLEIDVPDASQVTQGAAGYEIGLLDVVPPRCIVSVKLDGDVTPSLHSSKLRERSA